MHSSWTFGLRWLTLYRVILDFWLLRCLIGNAKYHTDEFAGKQKEGVLKNEAVADAGDRERLTGTFAGETKNREGAVPGADGGRRF